MGAIFVSFVGGAHLLVAGPGRRQTRDAPTTAADCLLALSIRGELSLLFGALPSSARGNDRGLLRLAGHPDRTLRALAARARRSPALDRRRGWLSPRFVYRSARGRRGS